MARAEKDFAELLRSFDKRGVRYLIIGAFAVAFHAVPRYTKDLDIWVDPTEENGRRICAALKDFGFGTLRISPKDFAGKKRLIQLGYEPVRVDLATSIAGVPFDEAWRHKKTGRYGGVKALFLSLEDLVRNKRATRRKQDLADLEILRKVKKHR